MNRDAISAEKSALDKKIKSLEALVNGPDFKDVQPEQQAPLTRQLAILRQLSDVLRERIDVFKVATPSSEQ